MKEHTKQHLDKLAKKLMQSALLESPSIDFTANIMAKVEALAISPETVYKPLISRRSWLLISIIVISSLIFGILGNDLQSASWLNSIDYSFIYNNKITETISGITFSKPLLYAVFFFGVVFFIQIPMMKHYFDKRLEH